MAFPRVDGGSKPQNRTVNSKGKIIYSMGAPKDTSMGMDLSANATNTRERGVPRKPLAPSSNSQSRNGA